MFSGLRHMLLLLTAVASFIILPAYEGHATESTQGCGMSGTPSGQMFVTTNICAQTTPVTEHIFSYIVCNFMNTLNTVLGSVYCGFMNFLGRLMLAVLTIYVAIYGIQLMAGLAQLTARDFVVRLAKIGLVTMFVTSSFWGIEAGFEFFLGAIDSGTYWALKSLPSGVTVTPTSGGTPLYAYLDAMIYEATIGPFTYANSKLVGFFVALAVVLPPVVAMLAYWLWENFLIMVRAMITFMLAISAIAFLISLSPIFLSLMLFQPTYHFFQSWLKYMISYTLQIIVVFACIALWLTVTATMIDYFNGLADTIYPYQKAEAKGVETTTNDSWGICPYELISGPTGQPLPVCTVTTGPGYKAPIPLSKVPEERAYVYSLIYNIIFLLIITYGFGALIRMAPDIGREIAGAGHGVMMGSLGSARFGLLNRISGQGQGGGSGLGAMFRGTGAKAPGGGSDGFIKQSVGALQRLTR